MSTWYCATGNIQGTFRERSGNVQGTSREHLGNIQHLVLLAPQLLLAKEAGWFSTTWGALQVTPEACVQYQYPFLAESTCLASFPNPPTLYTVTQVSHLRCTQAVHCHTSVTLAVHTGCTLSHKCHTGGAHRLYTVTQVSHRRCTQAVHGYTSVTPAVHTGCTLSHKCHTAG
jgi:hypothetical protein